MRWLELVLLELLLLVLIMVTLVLLARRDVTVTGPEQAAGVTTDTPPCWMDTPDDSGGSPSDDLPDVSGFTDIDCAWRPGPEIIVCPPVYNKKPHESSQKIGVGK